MLDLTNPAIAWLFDGSAFSNTILACLGLTGLFWFWTRWPEWAWGFAMVATFVLQMIIR